MTFENSLPTEGCRVEGEPRSLTRERMSLTMELTFEDVE